MERRFTELVIFASLFLSLDPTAVLHSFSLSLHLENNMPGTLIDKLTVKLIPYAASVGKRLRNEQFGCIVEGIHDINNIDDETFKA